MFLVGLATDFCVAWSALDARKAGFAAAVIEDATGERRLRVSAIHALANGNDLPASELAYLRTLYGRFDDEELKEAVIFAMPGGGYSRGYFDMEFDGHSGIGFVALRHDRVEACQPSPTPRPRDSFPSRS